MDAGGRYFVAVLALRDVCNRGTRQQTGYKASVLDASRWLGTARYITDIRCAMSFLGLSWFPDQKFALRLSWHVAVATMPNDPIFDGVARFPWSSDNSPTARRARFRFQYKSLALPEWSSGSKWRFLRLLRTAFRQKGGKHIVGVYN